MRHRLAMLGVVAAMSGMLSPLVSQAPAQAAVHDVCSGTGTITTAAPLVWPFVGQGDGDLAPPITYTLSPRSTNFLLSFNLPPLGLCLSGTTPHAWGHMTGWCGLAVGTGTTSSGNRFTFIMIGLAAFVVTGDLLGNGTSATALGQTCLTGANGFTFHLPTAIALSCTTKVKIAQTVTLPPASISSPLLPVHFESHGGNVHLSSKICIP